jgi:hypothetical protein
LGLFFDESFFFNFFWIQFFDFSTCSGPTGEFSDLRTLSTGFEKTTLVTEGNLYLIQRFYAVMELLVAVGLEQVCFFLLLVDGNGVGPASAFKHHRVASEVIAVHVQPCGLFRLNFFSTSGLDSPDLDALGG